MGKLVVTEFVTLDGLQAIELRPVEVQRAGDCTTMVLAAHE
jgi:hypothetical protein